MRKSSKMLSLVIALIFLFSAVTPALALSADAPDAGARLKSLGVIAGYPDGSLGLDRNITRAEMTVVLSEMYGMGQASEILKNVPSKFSDIATGAWYTGYVNLAQQQGWVSGYPDGSFKPNANVSYAEAITMIVNLLGYGKGELPGTWPLNYVVQATDLGITSGVTYSANSPAPRGDVFVMASKALDEYMVTWSKDESKFEDGELLITRLKLDELVDVTVTNAFMLLGFSENDREDRVVDVVDADGDALDTEYTVAAGFDIRPYIGYKTTFYVNDDDEIVAAKSASPVKTGTIDEVTNGGATIELTDGTELTVSSSAVLVVNEKVVTDDVYLVGAEGTIRYVVSSRQVVFADVVNYSLMDSGLVDELDVDDELVDIEFYAANPSLSALPFNTDDDYIAVKGAVSSLTDIDEHDVVYWNESVTSGTEEYVLYVVRNSVEGAADRWTNTSIRIAGKNYTAADDWFKSTDGGKEFVAGSGSDLQDFSGENVVAYLDGYGDLYAIAGAVSATADNVAVIDGNIERTQTGVNSYKYTVDLFLANGTLGTYEFDDDDIEVEVDGVVIGQVYELGFASGTFSSVTSVDGVTLNTALVNYSLNSSGKLDAFDIRTADVDTNITLFDDEMEDFKRIEGKYATSSSLYFQIVGDSDDWKMLTWAQVVASGTESGENFATSKLYYDDDDIQYIVFKGTVEAAADDYAVVIDVWSVGSGSDAKTYVEVVTNDGTFEYEWDGTGTPADEDLIKIDTISGSKITDASILSATSVTLPRNAYDSSRSRLNVGTEASPIWRDINSDTLIVDNTGDSPVVINASSLSRDDVVEFYVDSILIKVMVIVD